MLSITGSSRWALLSLLSVVASANVLFTGASVELNGTYYFIDPHVAAELPVPQHRSNTTVNGGFAAISVIRSASNATSLTSLFESWSEVDDVFQPQFLSGGVYIAAGHALASSKPSSVQFRNVAAPSIQTLQNASLLPSGPYFLNLHTGQAHRALRLYDDYTNSFTGSLLHNPDGSVQTLSAGIPTAMTLTIGVPSRLYYTRTAARPLAGVRLGVKDLYAVRGARRSNGNRAWYHLYPASRTTAPSVQRLVDAGAVVVGYQALAQFANGDRYTSDAVDMHMPFNPRGDGYSVPLGSSSGAGASVAAYPWLDLALGSDTGGSVRNPAQVAGVFGNRPTRGLVTLDDVTPLAPTLDTPGFTARDPALWDAAQQVLYGSNYTSLAEEAAPEYPKTIFVADWPLGKSADVDRMLNKFVNATVEITGAQVEKIDLQELWERTRPSDVREANITVYLNTTYATIVSFEQWNLVGKKFFADYGKKYNGRKPFVNPSASGRWEWASKAPESAYRDAKLQQETVSRWFREHVLAATGNASCSSALLLYSDHWGAPDLRTKLRGITIPWGSGTQNYSPMAGTPDFAFPLGELRTMSNITGREEPLPVSADIMAARGCDGLITRLGLELVKKGAVKIPKAGGTLDGGEVLFRREMGLL
ncbi:hypothetical protein PWT90_02568 [Aphanocladium album]|nr:hypothetical protein PWT90_02568 [Aphanocladium album]